MSEQEREKWEPYWKWRAEQQRLWEEQQQIITLERAWRLTTPQPDLLVAAFIELVIAFLETCCWWAGRAYGAMELGWQDGRRSVERSNRQQQ